MIRGPPSKRPQTAISLISPPPKLSGTASVIRYMGRLTASPPIALLKRVIPGSVTRDRNAGMRSAAVIRFGMRMVLKSVYAIAAKIRHTSHIMTARRPKPPQ